ncbi:GntR family transcriptional regulator [Mesobacillus maritimus]|uniref:GntR family transcriptional regulator n=1 Tax=Mesobacillus maritimus TaxID=1643336 RepID=UPI00203CFD5A|nr:GntR family transcriptional regulator [Mesobacillus maritimus]MCM3668702.1 GntR family transcriptional regulator [Mesobacillus maritimus]
MNRDKKEEIQESLTQSGMAKEMESMIANLEGLERYRLPQRAYHIVRLAIRELVLSPGKTVLEREVAEILQMSRTPVREALVRLETEGMVRLIPRRGFIVEPIEKEALNEIYEIVETMDGLAAERASEKITSDELDKLDSLILQQEEALLTNDLKKWAGLDDEFHNRLIQYANNKRLNVVVDIFSDQLYRARLYTIHHRPIPSRSIEEHKAVLACMRANDGAAARMVMQTHRKRARKEIIAALDRIKG